MYLSFHGSLGYALHLQKTKKALNLLLMRKLLLTTLCFCVGMHIYAGQVSGGSSDSTLRKTIGQYFLIGTTLNGRQIMGTDKEGCEIAASQFNAISPEGCMKIKAIHPEENRYDFTEADRFVAFGEKHHQAIIGHTLIWHAALPDWFCTDREGKDVSPEVLKKRMKQHISTVVGRYKGRIKGWDVVNEAFADDGTYRNSPFYRILGEEFIPLAFQYAHEADPDVELYYNDFNLYLTPKREAIIRVVKELQRRNLRIDAVGMQGHLWQGSPTVESVERAIVDLAKINVEVMVTELDLTALPAPKKDLGGEAWADFEYDASIDPYRNGLPAEVEARWTGHMLSFFKLFLKHKDVITRVTLWGVSDGDSWRNGWPVRGRVDYPLLFDRNHQPKPVVDCIIKETSTKR